MREELTDDGKGPVTPGEPLLVEPVSRDFEYVVRLAVAIPLAWATVLKAAGEQHYDRKCRAMAEHGVVSVLYNIAVFNEDSENLADRGSWPSTCPIDESDCDGMLKILEQTSTVDSAVAGEIRAWLGRAMEQIVARHREISLELKDVVAVLTGVVRRTQLLRRRLARSDAAGLAGTQTVVVQQMLERAEFQLDSALLSARRIPAGRIA